ncbi:MAG: flavodoxin family protein, partial [Nocardioidaceae bacterium]
MDPLRALVLVCTLKKTPAESSSQLIATQLTQAFREEGVESEVIRVVDHDVKFGVTLDEGDGDAWPGIRRKLMDSDILVLATPIWLGQPSSVAKLVLERLDAELSETDDEGRMMTYGKVAAVAVVGNEDGAHHVVAEAFQALNDVGFTIAANA